MKHKLCMISVDDGNMGKSCYIDAKRNHRGIPRARESIRIRLTIES